MEQNLMKVFQTFNQKTTDNQFTQFQIYRDCKREGEIFL